MKEKRLCIIMVGLPARGKSTIASKLRENLLNTEIKTRIFNNGDLRRKLDGKDTSNPEFFNPDNKDGVRLREKIALKNIQGANDYLKKMGQVAILDATNVSTKRRRKIVSLLGDFPLLFIECFNNDEEILEASIHRKVTLPEFRHQDKRSALGSFKQRINFYKKKYSPPGDERNFIKMDSLYNRILDEEITDDIPYYDQIRDILVADTVKNLFLIRHGETYFNLKNRIGGNSGLTENGKAQAGALAEYFKNKQIPVIFTSKKRRTIQTAEPIKKLQESAAIIPLEEFNEIDSGICECMSYEEIRKKMPHVYLKRKKDKYGYIYPEGEGYISMKKRIDRGIKKALYLSGNSPNIMIIGHRAVNRMILSHFMYRRKDDVPYIYVPQDRFYHVVATQDRKLFQLKKYSRKTA
ncbi:MAG: 6-phosphofructo-2-kinase/fructose-2,6-bisphosphatase [Desulfobacterales bacterium]|nr:6-phosphofructo-2-kinase/fructose-2,6-bisphosphatase [Desulfobacterales bacterium]